MLIHFANILPMFFHSRWGLHPHIDGETRPEITDNDGKPYLCADKAWTNVLFPGDSTGNWGLTSSSSSSIIIHDLGIPINQPMIGFEHCLNRSDDAWMVVHQNVLLMDSSSLWDSAKSR